MPLGLGSNLSRAISKPITPGIVTDNLVLKHKYDAGSVVPVSDGAASFDGTDDYINTGFIPDYIHTNASMGMWVYFNSISEQTMGHHDSKRWYMGILSDGDLFMGVADANTSASNIDGGIVANKWFHFAVTAIDGTATFYVDGVAKGTDSYTQNSATNPDSAWYIGARKNGAAIQTHIDGYIANVFQYNVGLTQAQIKSIMNKNYAGLTTSEKTNLVSWWNLDSSIAPNYDGIGTSGTELAEPSAMTGLILDNHDETLTEVSLTNSDFTSGSGTTITDWNNSHGGLWERSGDTIISPNGVSLFRRSDNSLTNGVAHKLIVRAKNTVPGSTSRLQVYFGGNNHARYDLTDDFQEYTFQGIQQNDRTFILYNPTGGDSTNVTIDWVKLYKYDGNVGLLV